MEHTHLLALAALLVTASASLAARPSASELAERDRWMAASFPEFAIPARASEGELAVEECYDWLLQNAFVDDCFHIGGRTYYRGMLAHANSRLVVRLPGAGARFRAIVGVDSNHMTRGGQGAVVFRVEVGGQSLFTSPVMREGNAGCAVEVDLGGATEFTLAAGDSGDGIACDQAIWADARVTLADGRELLVGDMPIVEGQDGPPFAGSVPFSFVYDGKPFGDVSASWERTTEDADLGDGRIAHRLTLRDPATGLVARCEAVYFTEFPTVEWTLWLENTGATDTPLIEDIQGLDLLLRRHGDPAGLGEFVLHHYRGEALGVGSLAQEAIEMRPGAAARYAPFGGRATGGEWPYYNIQSPTCSAVVGVGWPGQWAAEFTRDAETGLRVRAGQERTHLRLRPGESIRTPRIVLQFYNGDAARAQNVWREWMKTYNAPRPHGELPPSLQFGGSSRELNEMIEANEENQKGFIDAYLARGVPIDYWWMDAGWYVGAVEHGWPFVGTWEVDAERFPNGLRAVSDHAHARGLKTLLWFEPERVVPGTWLHEQHPEWLLAHPDDPAGQKLLNLGLPEAREWLTDHVDQVLTEQGIDLYRQDFNMHALPYWRAADAEDRQGIAENLHIQGYLAYWDGLRERHPDMLLDTCASGGQRMDLESLRRAVPLWRSDHAFEVIGNQNLTYGLAQWVPYFGTGNMAYSGSYYGSGATPIVPYDFWSTCVPANAYGLDVRVDDMNWPAFLSLVEKRAEIIDCFLGDFYPLGPSSTDPADWIAWQLDKPDEGRGVVMVFGRGESNFVAARYRLRGLDTRATYRVTDVMTGKNRQVSGEELLQRGLRADIDDAPGATVIAYEKL